MAGIFDNARGALGRLVAAATPGAAAPAERTVTTRDSIANAEARLGIGTDNMAAGAAYNYSVVTRSRQNLDNAYRGSWLVGVAVDAVADDMTRGGIEYAGDLDPSDGEDMHTAFAELHLWTQLAHVVRWARLYGGAVGLMLIDGQDVATPLRPETVRRDQFKGLLVLDRWMVNPSLTDLVQEFGPHFGLPTYYTVNVNPQMGPGYGGASNGMNAPGQVNPQGQRIHYTRVIRMDGGDLPFFARQTEMGWGMSVIERLYDRLLAFDSATQGAAQLVYRAHLRTLKMKGLRTTIATGGKSLQGLVESVNFMRRFQSIEGLTVLDTDDEFATHSYSFTGLPELLAQFEEQLSGALQIPLVRLFGQSPAGFNTGDADLQNYYDTIASQQNSKLRPGLTTLVDIVARSRLGRPLPDGVSYKFIPLWQMTAAEKADVASKVTTAVTGAESAGIISRKVALEELRQSSATTGVFTNISDEDITEAELDPPKPNELDPPDPNNPEKPNADQPRRTGPQQ